MRQTDDYDAWDIPTYHTFIAVKKPVNGQEPVFAFPPATEQQILETEQQLGFPLPPLLRLLYTQVANGGFGPGYGILGAVGGYPGLEYPPGTIVQQYRRAVEEAQESRQDTIKRYLKMDREEQRVGYRIGPDGNPTPTWEHNLPQPWPNQLLPLCDHGCNITTYLFADTEQVVGPGHAWPSSRYSGFFRGLARALAGWRRVTKNVTHA